MGLGAEVTVIEFMDSIGGAGLDKETAKTFMRILKRQGINFQVSTKVTGADASGDKVALEVENKKGKASTIEAEKVLVSVGRRRYADGLGLEDVGVATDERGMVLTDGMFKTNVDSIYAIGDIIDGPMLAHKAEEDGIMLAELYAGHEPHIDYDSCPGVIYTAPEVAWVGKSEEELKEAGISACLCHAIRLLVVLLLPALGLRALNAARAVGVSQRRAWVQDDVLLAVRTHPERRHRHHLLANADVALADHRPRVVDRLGQPVLVHQRLEAALKEVLQRQTKHVVQLHVVLVQQPPM